MKIKTKYNIGDTVIYETDNGLRLAKVDYFEISISKYNEPSINYELTAKKENHFITLNLSEKEILAKATKKLIRKYYREKQE